MERKDPPPDCPRCGSNRVREKGKVHICDVCDHRFNPERDRKKCA